MISSYTRYGALSAKVRAMYGKRLRLADFEHMASLTDQRDVLGLLRGAHGWAAAANSLSDSQGYVGRVELEEALDIQLDHDYESLSHFVPKGDKALVSFPMRRRELEEIMAALRRLKSGEWEHEKPLPPSGLKIDRMALHACTDYPGLLSAVKESIYSAPLVQLKPSQAGELPDYPTAEVILQSAYYAHLYKTIHQNYGGETEKALLRSFGEQVDLLNLIHLLRVKTYFPGEDGFYSVLFPFGYKLRSDKLKLMRGAATAEDVFTLLADTPYAKAFDDLPHTASAVETYYRRAFYQLNKRQLSGGEPSVYTAVAYLNLKELELQALINVIESVKYGVRYDDSFARMVGD